MNEAQSPRSGERQGSHQVPWCHDVSYGRSSAASLCISLVLVCSLNRGRNKTPFQAWRQMGGNFQVRHESDCIIMLTSPYIFDRKTTKLHDTQICFPFSSSQMQFLAQSFKVIFSPRLWHGWLPARYKEDPNKIDL